MTCYAAHSEFTLNEARRFLETGEIPLNIRDRMRNRFFHACENCDGRRCMGCVMRVYDHTCGPETACSFCDEVSDEYIRRMTG